MVIVVPWSSGTRYPDNNPNNPKPVKNRIQSLFRPNLSPIRAAKTWFRIPALVVSSMLPWLASARGDTVTYNTAGTFIWTCPPGVNSISVAVQGGGGGGGGGGTTSAGRGGGGGGGGCAYSDAVAVVPGTDYTVTVGAGGAAGAATTGTGGTGGTSSFSGTGITTLTATGGAGGALGGVSNGAATAAGTATGGAFNFSGGTGGGARINTTGGGGGGGAGTTSAGGNASGTNGTTPGTGGTGSPAGGAGTGNNNTVGGGTAGNPPGGGGAGAYRGSGTQAGKAGGAGQVTITFTAPLNVKADNPDPLNLATSWTVGVPIGVVAEWNNIVSSANTTSSLGADLAFGGIKISDPAGPVTINPGNILTLGSAAVDLDLSSATQNLTLNCGLALGAANVWNVASGRTVTLGGTVSGTGTITKQGSGSAVLSGSSTYSGATTVSDGTLVYPSGSTFSPGGTGGVSGKLTVNGSSAEATLAGTYTATGNSDAYFEIRGGGLLSFSGTANLSGTGGIRVGEASAGAMNMTAGTLSASMNSGSNFVVGRNAGANGTLNLSGGTISVTNAGGLVIANNATASGVVNISGTGQLLVSSTGTSAFGPGTATVNLNSGGTFTLGTSLTASGTSTINFNGGTLKAGRSSTSFLPATLSAVNILTAGAVIDTNGFDITLPGALLSGVAGDGGLTKTGASALTLAGANTYTGNTNVNQGVLKLSTAATNVSDVVVAAGAGAGARVETTDGQLVSSGDLSLNNNGNLVIDYGVTAPSTSVAPLQVDNLVVGTGHGLLLQGDLVSTLAVGQSYPLVKWTTNGPSDGSSFTGGLTHRLAGTFSVDVPNKTLVFTVTANTIGAISWDTGNGNWDTTTTNWRDVASASVAYVDPLDDVLFGDALGAAGNPVITLNTVVSPTGVRMKSTGHDYTITGTGSIAGSTGLTLDADNTRTLTIATSNTYTGATAIVGGTLQLGDGGTGGALNTASAISIGSGATFAVNQSDTVTQGTDFSAAALAGAGSFTKSGSGTTILNAANTYSGTTTVSAGTLEATVNSTTSGVGTSALSIGSGATLLLNNTFTTASGALVLNNTVTGSGLLNLQFAANANARNLQLPNASGFNGTIRLSSLGATGDKFNTTGVGVTGAAVIVDAGNTLYIPNGTPDFTGGITISGSGNTEGRGGIRLSNATLGGNISLIGDATINLDNVAAVLSGDITSGASGTQTLTLGATGSTGGALNGVIGGGTGTLNLATGGAGAYVLTNANTYAGTTTVNTGAIRAQHANALGSTAAGTVVNGSASGGTNNARLELSGGIAVTGEPLTINGAGNFIGALASASGNNEWAGPVTIGSASTRIGSSAGASLNISGVIDSGVDPHGVIIRTTDLTGVVVFSAANTYLGNTQVLIGKLQIAGDHNRLPVGTTLTLASAGSNPDAEFDLNGLNQEVAGLSLSGSGVPTKNSVNNSSATLATLTVNTPAATPSTFGGILKGNLALTKTGSDTLTLTNTANVYTGATTVSGGTLSLAAINAANESSTVTIAATGATLDLAFSGTDTVDKLFIGTTQMAAGEYGAVGSLSPVIGIPQITGTGTLTVTSGPAGGYNTWAATNAGGQTADLDFDNDGVTNGVEFFMNAAAGFTANPQLNGSNTITWPNGGNIPASAYGTRFVVQTSSNLVSWTDVPAVQLTTNTDGPGGSLTYTLTGAAPRFVRLVVTPN